MRKSIAFLLLIGFVLFQKPLQAQSVDSTKFLFEKLPDVLFPSGFFHHQSPLKYLLEQSDADLHNYNGNIGGPSMSASLFEEMYVDLFLSQRLASNGRLFGSQTPHLDSLSEFYENSTTAQKHVNVPIYLNWFELQELKDHALDSGYFNFSNGQFSLLPEYEYLDPQRQFFIHHISPLDSARKGIRTFTTFFAGTLAPTIYEASNSATVSFRLPDALVQSNQQLPATFDIDLSDGQGFRPIALNTQFTATYHTQSTAVEATSFQIRVRAKTATRVYESSFSIPVVFNVERPDLELITSNLPDPQCYSIQEPSEPAKVSVRFADPNLGLQKPLILVEGFESATKDYGVISYQGLSSGYIYHKGERVFQAMEKLSWLYDSLHLAGFDIVHVDFKNSRLSIKENMQSLIRTLNWVQEEQPAEPMVVVGASMGGLISRAALLELEREGCCIDIAAFGTFDTPHQGAFIPVGMQAAAKRMGEMLWFLPGKQSYNKAINSPAAREMLVEHLDQSASTDRFQILQLLGNEQPNLRRFAIVNGSDLGDYAPIQDAQKRFVGWGRSREVVYKHHLGNHPDTLVFNEHGRTRMIKALGGIAQAHQGSSSYLYDGNKRQAPFTFHRIRWASSFGAFKAKQVVKWGNILGMNTTFIDAAVLRVQQHTNDELTALIQKATKSGTAVAKISYSKKYAELPGSFTSTGEAFQSSITEVFSASHTFVPSYSALDLPSKYATSVLRSKMNDIPFHSYFAPGVVGDRSSENTEHIFTDEPLIDFCMKTLRSVYEDLPVTGNTLHQSYNVAKQYDQHSPFLSQIPSLTVQANRLLGIGLSHKEVGYAGSGIQADITQNIEVFLGRSCLPEHLVVKGELSIGGQQGVARLTVRKGSSLRISSGGILRLNERSKLLVQEGAQFIVEPGAKVFWDGASIVSQGQFILDQGASFEPIGSGTLSCQNGHRFSAIQGGTMKLKESTLLIGSPVTLVSSLQSSTLENSRVIYTDNASLRTLAPFFAKGTSFTMQGNKQWAGMIAAHDTIVLDSCELIGGSPSLDVGTAVAAKIERCTFRNALLGFKSLRSPIAFKNNEFSVCSVGAQIKGTNINILQNQFISCGQGLLLESQKGIAFIERSLFSGNTIEGIHSDGVDLRLICSAFEFNATGVKQSDAGIHLDNRAGCRFVNNVVGIEADQLTILKLNDGHNTFSGNSLTDIKATLSSNTPVGFNGTYHYFLANFNHFTTTQSTQIYLGRDRVFIMKTQNGSPSTLLCPTTGPAKMERAQGLTSQELELAVFPNPSRLGQATAQFESLTEEGTLRITTLQGQLVSQEHLSPGTYRVHFKVPQQAGPYLITLITPSSTQTKRWVLLP